MKREFTVDANIGAPQVAYREAIKKTVEQKVNLLNNLVVRVNMAMYG